MMNSELKQKINGTVDFEGEFLKNVRTSAREKGIPVMVLETASLLSNVVAIKKPKTILEIGTAVGYSGSLMLKHSRSETELTTIEISEDSLIEAKKNFATLGYLEKVKFFVGDVCDIVPKMSGNFDLILLDGPKSRYVDLFPFLKDLLANDGVVFSDNVLFRGLTAKNDSKRFRTISNNLNSFLQLVASDKDFISTLLEVGDGVLLSVKQKGEKC